MDGVFADSDPKSLPQSLLAVFPSHRGVRNTSLWGAPVGSPLHPLQRVVLLTVQGTVAALAPPRARCSRASSAASASRGGSPCPAGALARREGGCEAGSGSPMLCPRCGSEMRLIAVITDPAEVRKILRHLLQIGRAPPGQASRLLRVALASCTVDCGVFQGPATGKSSSSGMLTAARRPSQPL
jgi:hypothetical protein